VADEQSVLRERLAAGRRELLDAIEQPPLARIAGRAATIRRRRRLVELAGSLTVVLAAVLLTVQPWHGGPRRVQPAASAPAAPPVWRGLGISLVGLPAAAPDVPGSVVAVEFADPDRGYLVVADCHGMSCRITVARTTDGGQVWETVPVPSGLQEVRPADVPRIWAVGPRVVLAGGELSFASDNAGADWAGYLFTFADLPVVDSVPPGGRLWTDQRRPGKVLVWLPGTGRAAVLRQQPASDVRWVAAAPAGDGAWWAGGVDPMARPTALVSRDAGRSWQTTVLGESGAPDVEVRVATLGRQVYAATVYPDPRADRSALLHAIHHSTDGGAHFSRTWAGGGPPGALAGDPVPLVDDRLLLAGQDHQWYVSDDHGGTFRPAPGLLAVRSIARIQAGYVAYDLLGGGWSAFSVDGSNWYKLNLR